MNRSDTIRTLAAFLFFAVIATVLSVRTYRLLNVPGEPDPAEWGMHDFRDAVYYPVVATLNGDNPYNTPDYAAKYPVGQVYPLYSPLLLLLHLPYGLLPHRGAELAYYGTMLVMVVALSAISLRFCRLRLSGSRIWMLAGMILLGRPGHMNLVVANVTLQAVLGTYIALHFARQRPWLSGCALGLMTFKPTFGVPLMVLMLIRRDIRAVAAGVVVGFVTTVPITLLLANNAGGIASFVASIIDHHLAVEAHPGIGSVTESWARIDAYSVTVHLFGTVPAAAKYGLSVACLVIAGAVVWRRGAPPGDDRVDGPAGVMICLAVLAVIYHQAYDALLLTLPALAVIAGNREFWRQSGWRRWLIAAALAIPYFNYAATATGIGLLGLQTGGWPWAIVTSINGCAILTAMILVAWLVFARSRAAGD